MTTTDTQISLRLARPTIEDDARAAGADRLTLDVSARNRDARRLYERFGTTAIDASPLWFGLPNTNVTRLVKAL